MLMFAMLLGSYTRFINMLEAAALFVFTQCRKIVIDGADKSKSSEHRLQLEFG